MYINDKKIKVSYLQNNFIKRVNNVYSIVGVYEKHFEKFNRIYSRLIRSLIKYYLFIVQNLKKSSVKFKKYKENLKG